MIVFIVLISLLISIPGFVYKATRDFKKSFIPLYNLYVFFNIIKISPIFLFITGLCMIIFEHRMFFLTFLLILLPFDICEKFSKGKFMSILCLIFPFIFYPYIAYIGGFYVGDVLEEGNYFKSHKFMSLLILILSLYCYYNFTFVVEDNKFIDKDSIHYVNDLYMSDARIYNNYLDEGTKKLYIDMVNKIKKYDSSFNVSCEKYKCSSKQELYEMIFEANDAILIDHPELINYANFGIRDDGNDNLMVEFIFAKKNRFIMKLGEIRIKRIINRIKNKTKNMTDEEKIKYVYEWIGDNNTYDVVFTYSSKNQSIYNVFIKHNAVCAGFAKASQIIFQNIGIESYGVTGVSTDLHMWNIVKLNDKYYFYDSTVSACLKDKNEEAYYNGLNQKYMKDYKIDNENWYSFYKKEE